MFQVLYSPGSGKALQKRCIHRLALTDLIEALDGGVRVANEPQREECGAPDFVLCREALFIGYLETKDLGSSLEEAEDSDQLTFCV